MRPSHDARSTTPQWKAIPNLADEFRRERDAVRILRFKQVTALVGLGKSSIYRKIQEGTFPKPVKLGSARASGWISTEVYDWILDQVQRSRNAA